MLAWHAHQQQLPFDLFMVVCIVSCIVLQKCSISVALAHVTTLCAVLTVLA